MRSPRPFDAQDGTQLLSTEAWYTLNTLPGYVAPVSDGLYELEDGILTGGAQFDTEHAGYTGTGFVSGYRHGRARRRGSTSTRPRPATTGWRCATPTARTRSTARRRSP